MANPPIKLIVGLGNIGREYEQTRHNAGFWFADAVARKYGAFFQEQKKFFGSLAKFRAAGQEVLILKPSTLMNRSGQAVAAVAQFYKIKPEEIVVAHDELDLMPGIRKFKKGGGTGGHNGLKSISQCLGTQDYYRIRFGIGHPRTLGLPMDVSDFVLGKPSSEDMRKIEDNVDYVVPAVDDLVNGDIKAATLFINTQNEPKKQ